jgi:hypothetical protein
MSSKDESDESAHRLSNFAERYNALMAERPYMEMLARHTSMNKAGLTADERAIAARYIKSRRVSDLIAGPVAAATKPEA